jgi:hypothetical protein
MAIVLQTKDGMVVRKNVLRFLQSVQAVLEEAEEIQKRDQSLLSKYFGIPIPQLTKE